MSAQREAALAPPEPDLTPATLLERARDLLPQLRQEQAATEERGTYSPELHEAFDRAGFYRVLQPKSFGGYEFDVPTFMAMVVEIARGCPGAGWCLCLAAGHHLQAAGLFPASTQAEAYGPDGYFAAPCRPLPMGTAERTDGGWLISGKWDYCSGAPYSTHALLGVRLVGEERSAKIGLALVPREHWTMLDDWRHSTLGMSGSGSNSIEIEGATVSADAVVEGGPDEWPTGAHSAGFLLHGNPMYNPSLDGYGQLEIAAILVGGARAALDESERILRAKRTFGPNPVPRYAAPEYQRWFGTALAKVDLAQDGLMRSAERYSEACKVAAESGAEVSRLDLTRLNLVTNEVMESAWEAAELLFRTSGSSEGARNGSRMQRYYRDFSMAQTNVFPKSELGFQRFAAEYFELGELSLLG